MAAEPRQAASDDATHPISRLCDYAGPDARRPWQWRLCLL